MERVIQPPQTLPAAWVDVLETVQQALVGAEAAAAEREHAATTTPSRPGIDVDREEAWQERMRRIDERLQVWQRGIERSDREVSEVDSVLAEEAEELNRWLAKVQASHEELVNRAGHGI